MSQLFSPVPSVAASIPEPFLSLAPVDLPNFRGTRYQGDDLHVAITDLAEPDQKILRDLYAVFTHLLRHMTDVTTSDPVKWAEVRAWAKANDVEGLVDRVQSLGRATEAGGHSGEDLAKMLHDVRGGAMSALLGRLQLIDHLPQTEGQMKMLFALTRDHLKIMRNAVTGLDEARREADRTLKSHSLQLILDKWQGAVVGPYPPRNGRPIRMRVEARYEGALTECCLESAAIDRIFYNLAANAYRHCAGDEIELAIFEVPRAPGTTLLRFVMSNPVSGEDAARLGALGGSSARGEPGAPDAGAYLDAIFEPAVSSTGSGYGLTVVADFVAGAFGLRDKGEAVRRRYAGARLDGNIFRVFFHWPAASDAHPPKLDDYHRPQDSIAEASP